MTNSEDIDTIKSHSKIIFAVAATQGRTSLTYEEFRIGIDRDRGFDIEEVASKTIYPTGRALLHSLNFFEFDEHDNLVIPDICKKKTEVTKYIDANVKEIQAKKEKKARYNTSRAPNPNQQHRNLVAPRQSSRGMNYARPPRNSRPYIPQASYPIQSNRNLVAPPQSSGEMNCARPQDSNSIQESLNIVAISVVDQPPPDVVPECFQYDGDITKLMPGMRVKYADGLEKTLPIIPYLLDDCPENHRSLINAGKKYRSEVREIETEHEEFLGRKNI